MAAISLRALVSPVAAEPVPWVGTSLRTGPLDRLDRWTLGLIATIFLLLLINLNHLKPSMSDTWYHVSVAKQFMAEGIAGWDMWDYAPTGRPHLYPPLLHLILAALGRLTGSIMLASQLLAVTFLPLAMLTTWYGARRLLNSRVALLAVLLVLTDLIHFVIMEAHIAGCLVNILLPLLMVAFLTRRAWWSIGLLTLMFYSHLGFPICVALGLLLFGFKYRDYGRLALKVSCLSLLFFTPWLAHVLGHLDWLAVVDKAGMPGGPIQKLLSLQMFNLLLLGLGFWGLAVAPRNQPHRMLPAYLLIGFLPILFAYGGRYNMHTMPMWAILGGSVISPLLGQTASARRILGIMMLTLLPWPTVGFMGGFKPLPLTAPHLLAVLTVSGTPLPQEGDKGEAYRQDCEQLAAWLRKNTAPDDIIYVNTVWVGEMISLLADRRTDFGAWWECSKDQEKIDGHDLRDWLPEATFVFIKPDADAGSVLYTTPTMPGVDRTKDLGRFQIGLREPHWLAARGAPVSGWRALSVAGATGGLKRTPQGVLWDLGDKRDALAAITAPAPEGDFGGARLTLVTNAMAEDLVLGVRTPDGRDYRWPLSLALKDEKHNVRVVFDWMLDAKGKRWQGGKISEVYLSCPPKPSPDAKAAKRTLEVLSVELVPEIP